MVEPFLVKDCALISCMGGVEPAMNLRELRERTANCPIECLFHHFCQTVLRPTFDDPEFRNDLAVWAARDLRDRTVAERLGAINPYQFDDLEQLRRQTLEIIDNRLSELETLAWVPRGLEFRFMRSLTIVFDTGLILRTPEDFVANIAQMSSSTLYFHFVVAQGRFPKMIDDFSVWLEQFGSDTESIVTALRSVDFYYLTLSELKTELCTALKVTGT